MGSEADNSSSAPPSNSITEAQSPRAFPAVFHQLWPVSRMGIRACKGLAKNHITLRCIDEADL